MLEALLERRDLSEAQASEALQALVVGAEPAQMAAFLVLLRAKGETAEEVAGLAKAMRALSVPVQTPYDGGRQGLGGSSALLGGPRVSKPITPPGCTSGAAAHGT